MKISFNFVFLSFPLLLLIIFSGCSSNGVSENNEEISRIISHTDASLENISDESINLAKSILHIAYGHTSHGSQLIYGMTGLVSFKGDLYRYSEGGGTGLLDLRDTPFSGASDLGNPDRTAWESATRRYLDANNDINVIVWSWCGQVSGSTEAQISNYLSLMNQLETDYPDVVFVYMTGHLDGTGANGNLNRRNNQIRQFCIDNNKFLYDFADIESYDPDGLVNYMYKNCDDNCDYDSDGSRDSNWATDWQEKHKENVDWYDCFAAHSQALNGNLKAYAAWTLFCRIADYLNSL